MNEGNNTAETIAHKCMQFSLTLYSLQTLNDDNYSVNTRNSLRYPHLQSDSIPSLRIFWSQVHQYITT